MIIMVGIPGSGKSAFAERFADTFKAPILNRTKLQKDLQLDSEQVDSLAEVILKEFMKTKKTILLEGGLDNKKYRADLMKYFIKQGYRPLVVWVQTDTSEARRRALKSYPVGSGISDDEFETTVEDFDAPEPAEKAVVVSGKHTYATQLKSVLKQIALNSRAPQNPNTPPSAPQQPRGRGVTIR